MTTTQGGITRTITANDFINILVINHGDKVYRVRDFYKYSGTIPALGLVYPAEWSQEERKAFNDFYFIWRAFWNSERIYNYFEALDTMHIEYNPLENYDKTSDIITGESVTPYEDETTQSGGYSDIRTIKGTETTETGESGTKTNTRTFNNTDDTDNLSSTDENTLYRNDTKSTTGHTGTISDVESYDHHKTTVDKSYSNDFEDKLTKEYDNMDTTTRHYFDAVTKIVHDDTIAGVTKYNHVYDRTSGNIGVTTSQQMAESELVLREHNLIDDYANMFVRDYLFYI